MKLASAAHAQQIPYWELGKKAEIFIQSQDKEQAEVSLQNTSNFKTAPGELQKWKSTTLLRAVNLRTLF